MKSGVMIVVAALGLVACGPGQSPERGVGFDDFSAFELDRARREAALSAPRESIIPPPQVNTIPGPVGGPAIPASELAAAGIGQTPENSALDPERVAGLDASPTNPAPNLQNNPGISDEQNFDAVSGRETIESDAERRAAQAAAREEIAPTAVPDRPRDTGPNIVEYALNAPNVKGQEWYSRSILAGQNRFQRNCAAYPTPDDAQRDFLARGGPERDRLGIDPDGDGFACGWDPAPFKAAFQN
ncbi:hypothetical protein [Cognatiyoonia sp. IB215182]|uniref:hypothetical protein n=1 Tax=Cognatiyoonia sp. IB215182 TaxID=3097353 RepID=UPI002A1629DC|nr:hypothetical protein [Cognatiyoonia sp. IB215182]MDX8351048.1 hypothetical protein [Cognatiyoonia sp. IB215182]